MSKGAEALSAWDLEDAILQLCWHFKVKRNKVLQVWGRLVDTEDGKIPEVHVGVPGYTLVAKGTYRAKVPLPHGGGRKLRLSTRQMRADQAKAAHAKYLKNAARDR